MPESAFHVESPIFTQKIEKDLVVVAEKMLEGPITNQNNQIADIDSLLADL